MIHHLTSPFAAGAVETMVPITPSGRVVIGWETREPLVLAAPSRSLGGSGLRLRAVLDPDGGAEALTTLGFAAYTEAGAYLPLHRPQVSAGTRKAPPFILALTLSELKGDGTETPVANAGLGDRLTIRVVEGIMGRIIYVLGAEKQRLRREARELSAMRLLSEARDDALDRIGADLGVARFSDEIHYDPAKREIVTSIRRSQTGAPIPEPDEEYRRRLSLYRAFVIPSCRSVLELLNGHEDPQNQGLIRALGFTERFRVVETDNPFGVAIHLVAAGDPAFRQHFLEHIRAVRLLWPQDGPAADSVHAGRYLPVDRRERVDALRASLRSRFLFPDDAPLAPMLAAALNRAGQCRQALGVVRKWRVLRAQDGGGGSRYELGLGLDVETPPAQELNVMASLLADANRPPAADPETEGLLRSMTPRPAAQDREGSWLLGPCGFRTVHRVDANRVYLSHLPTFGMVITGPSGASPGAEAAIEVHYHAAGDPGSNAVLSAGITAASADWTSSGGGGWTVLTDAQARTLWSQAAPRPAGDPALGVFRAAGLPAVEDPGPVVAKLERLPQELVGTVRLADPQVRRILNGEPAAADELRAQTALLRNHGLSSVLPLVTGPNEVALVIGVIGLPEAGINLSERRATGFRWYVVPLQGQGGEVKAVGSRTVFVPGGPGLSALVAVGYARRGFTDPYEFRVELPADAKLNLKQYEFFMNLMGQAHPLGVEVNTFSIRREHVDLDGDGKAEALPPAISRTYRRFRRSRLRGELGVGVADTQ
jgi:hypothetical protein